MQTSVSSSDSERCALGQLRFLDAASSNATGTPASDSEGIESDLEAVVHVLAAMGHAQECDLPGRQCDAEVVGVETERDETNAQFASSFEDDSESHAREPHTYAFKFEKLVEFGIPCEDHRWPAPPPDAPCNAVANAAVSPGSVQEALKSLLADEVVELDMTGLMCGDSGAREIAGALEHNTRTTALNLSFNQISHVGAFHLATALLRNHTLLNLNLCGNYIGEQATGAVSQAFRRSSSLKTLNLAANSDACRSVDLSSSDSESDEGSDKSSLVDDSESDVSEIEPSSPRDTVACTHCCRDGYLKEVQRSSQVTPHRSRVCNVCSKAVNAEIKTNPWVCSLCKTSVCGSCYSSRAKRSDVFKSHDFNVSEDPSLAIKSTDSAVGEKTTQPLFPSPSPSPSRLPVKASSVAQAVELLEKGHAEELDVFGVLMGDDGARRIATALCGNTSVQSLNLSVNRIGVEGAACLADSLKRNSTLTSLSLRGNYVRCAGAKSLAEALEGNKALKVLNLSSNGICSPGALRLAQALRINEDMDSLSLAGNGIGPRAMTALVESLGFSSLSAFSAMSNDVRSVHEEGNNAQKIADALELKSPCMVLTASLTPCGQVACTSLGGRQILTSSLSFTLCQLLAALSSQTGLAAKRHRIVRPDGQLLKDGSAAALTLGVLLGASTEAVVNDAGESPPERVSESTPVPVHEAAMVSARVLAPSPQSDSESRVALYQQTTTLSSLFENIGDRCLALLPSRS